MSKHHQAFRAKTLTLAFLSVLSVDATAGDLAFSGNLLDISGASATTIASNGIASRVTGVPKTSGIGIPSISFELTQASMPQNGTYSFRVGVVIDDDNSIRRIEAMIATVNIAVNGSSLSASIPSGTALRVLGRNTVFTVEMNTTNPSSGGPISVSGGNISFDADSFIQKIADSNASLESIINDFGNDTHYTYQIIAQQTAGPEDLRLGTLAGATFNALPCMSPSEQVFELNNALASSFSLGFGLQGQFSITGATGQPGASPTPFTGVCVEPPVADDSVAGRTNAVSSAANAVVIPSSGPLSAQSLATLTDTLTLGLTLANQTASELAGAGVSAATTLSALESMVAPLQLAGQALGRGNNIDASSLTAMLDGISASIAALRTNTTLDSAQKARLADLTNSLISANSALVTSTYTDTQRDSLHSSSQNLLEQALLSGATLSSTTLAAAQSLSEALAAGYIGASQTHTGLTIDFNNNSQATNLIRNNKFILDGILRFSPTLNHLSPVDSALMQTSLEHLGLNSLEASNLIANLASNLIDPSRLTLDNSLSINLTTLLQSPFANSSVSYDSASARILVLSSGSTLSLQATALKLVPNAVPNGLSILANGQWLIVSNGIAIELTPTPLDSLGFYAALSGASLPITLASNGSMNIDLGSGASFSAITNFDYLTLANSDCGALSLTAPTGDPQSSDYRYELHCANGATQRLLPYMFNPSLYVLASSAGYNMTTDLATGILTIQGLGSFKPSYFVEPLTAADDAFLDANAATPGLAFRAAQLNTDSIVDFEMITPQGKQNLFGL